MPKIAEYYSEISIRGVSGVLRSLDRVRSGFVGLAGAATAPIRSLGGLFTGLISPVGLVTTALGAAGVAGSAGILKLASDTESLATQFRVLLGSADAAQRMMEEINRFAAATPFEQMQLADAAKQLLAFGEGQASIIPTLRQLGDIAALSGARLEDLVQIYGKVRGQGKLTAETLDQFQSRGIPIIGELAKQFGVAETQIREMVSSGQIGFAEVQAAIAALTSEGGRFAGGMEQLSQTTGGLWSTVTGNFKTLLASFGESIIKAFNLKSVLAGLGEWLGNLASNWQTIAGPVIDWFVVAMRQAVSSIQNVWTTISNWLMGIWAQWGGAIRQYFSTVFAIVNAVGEAFFSVFSAILAFVSNIFGRLQGLIENWFGITQGGLAKTVEDWLASIQFVAENWQLYLQVMWENIKLFFANMVARAQALATNIGRIVVWIWNNWQDIFKTIGNFTYSIFTNLLANLRALWQAFWNFLKTGQWEVDWTPLTESFESAIKEMPDLVAAEVAETTPALERLHRELASRWEEFEKRRKQGKLPRETKKIPTATAAPAIETAGPGIETTGPGAATAPTAAKPEGRPGRGTGISFVGLAALANQMQEETGKRLQEQMAKATEKTAEGIDRLAAAADGGTLRVKVVGGTEARYS